MCLRCLLSARSVSTASPGHHALQPSHDRGVCDHCEQYQQTLYCQLPEGGNLHEGEGVVDDAEQEGTQDGAQHGAAAAEYVDPTHDRGRDSLKLKAESRISLSSL